jgi:hypothetical protein
MEPISPSSRAAPDIDGRTARGAPAAEAALDDGPGRPSAGADDQYLALAERLAYWMDRRYVDPILGFVLPGVGDALGAGIGLLGIFAAFRLRAHPILIARMLIHLAVDSALGSIPVLGAVIDIFYRSHTRNLNLLKARDAREAHFSDWLVVGGAALIFLIALALPIVILIVAVSLLA